MSKKKQWIIIICCVILLCFILTLKTIIHQKNQYWYVDTPEIKDLWDEFDNYMNLLSENYEKIKDKMYEDFNQNMIRILVKSYYEYNAEDGEYSYNFYEFRNQTKIKKNSIKFYITNPNAGHCDRIFSNKVDYENSVLNHYAESYCLISKHLLNTNPENFEEIMKVRIIQIQLVNSMAEWLVYNGTEV